MSGDIQHFYRLYNLDGFRLVVDQPLSLSDGSNFDVDATGATSFVTVEHDDLGDPGGSGIDTVVTYWEFDNIVFGTAGADVLSALGPDRILVGREGNDLFFIDSQNDAILERANQGDADRVLTSVDYVMPQGLTVEILSTNDNLGTAPIGLAGNDFAQYIYGNAGANRLGAFSGLILPGDTLTGFEGDDSYLVNPADQVREAAGGGNDEVTARTSWVMTAGQEIELLKTTSNIGTDAIDFTGNEFSQYIYGNKGNNVIRAGGGGDVMTGFEGNDTYYVDHAADQVREDQYVMGNISDRVIASVSWVLGAGQEVELIETIDAAATTPIHLIANELDGQNITGNAGNNTLDGGGGQHDVMIGLGGDDIYIVRNAGDHILEAVGAGFDRVMALTSYTLPGAEIEILATIDPLATTAIDLTGNSFAQYLYGNAGVNRLNGGAGGDVLTGLGGDDLYDIVSAADEVREVAGGGVDRVFAHVSYTLNAGAAVDILSTLDNLATTAINISGNELAQYVYGNAGSNTLGGGAGRDVLTGLGGSDFFLFDTALNTGFTSSFATLGENANVDRIDDFGVDDRIALKGSLFGFTPGALPAGAFNTGTTATQADDRILYDSASGALLFDSDGTGAAAAQLIAFINNPFNLDFDLHRRRLSPRGGGRRCVNERNRNGQPVREDPRADRQRHHRRKPDRSARDRVRERRRAGELDRAGPAPPGVRRGRECGQRRACHPKRQGAPLYNLAAGRQLRRPHLRRRRRRGGRASLQPRRHPGRKLARDRDVGSGRARRRADRAGVGQSPRDRRRRS